MFVKHHSRDLPPGDWRTFVVVRDPIERMGSFWAFNARRRHPERHWSFVRWFRYFFVHPSRRTLPKYQSMTEWVDALDATPLHLETLDADLAAFGLAGPPVDPANVGHSKPFKGRWRDSISADDLDLVLQHHRDDFTRFGYPVPEVTHAQA